MKRVPGHTICGECGARFTAASAAWDDSLPCGHTFYLASLEAIPAPEEFRAAGALITETAARLVRDELELCERAVTGWAKQAGMTVEQWGKFYGYRIEREFADGETGALKVRVKVVPVLLRDLPVQNANSPATL